jgi:hypothetical protein
MERRDAFHTFSLLVEIEVPFTPEFVTCDYKTWDSHASCSQIRWVFIITLGFSV